MAQPTDCKFSLFVNGSTANAALLISQVRVLLERILIPESSLTVVDVSHEIRKAEEAGIRVTPALVREKPLPRTLVWGDFSTPEKLTHALKRSLPAK